MLKYLIIQFYIWFYQYFNLVLYLIVLLKVIWINLLNKYFKKIIGELVIFSLLLIGYYFFNKIFSWSIPCLFHQITNLYCPGCGITRMLFSIIKLDFYQAFRYNPLVFILLVGYLLMVIYSLIFHKKVELSNKVTYGLLIIVILFGVLRNIPGFEFLAPINI